MLPEVPAVIARFLNDHAADSSAGQLCPLAWPSLPALWRPWDHRHPKVCPPLFAKLGELDRLTFAARDQP